MFLSGMFAQPPDTLWVKTYGGPYDDYGNGVCETVDHDFILTGMSCASNAGDLYVIKTDKQGDSLWARRYGGAYWDHGYAIKQTADTGFIITGYTCSFSPDHNEDFLLVKIDSAGEQQWINHYGGDSLDVAYSLAIAADSGYIMTGKTHSFGAGEADIYCVKVHANGDTIWTRTYGGSADEGSYGILARNDSCYIIVGHTASQGAGNSDVYLLCVDGNGDTIWTRTYGGAGFDFGYGITATRDSSGYAIIGKTRSFGAGGWDVYLLRVDENGDLLWTNVYGGCMDDVGFDIYQVNNGGFILTGYTMSYGSGNADIYFIKTNAQGDTIWTSVFGGVYEDIGRSIMQVSDSTYLCCGLTNSFGPGGCNCILIKLATDTPGIEQQYTAYSIKRQPLLTVYPNPFYHTVQFRIKTFARDYRHVSLNIYDCLGKRVKTFIPDALCIKRRDEFSWDGLSDHGDRLSSGVYYIEFRADKMIERHMVVYLH